ncbi:MAG: hypothetical protein AUH05_04020 [Ktedonobacter sp. 13_2_20CM_53_11]|nr:MAG: hypothetical protein AUH05_04020 [Ktedonobacter sp. 13_2_20CM_53_11]
MLRMVESRQAARAAHHQHVGQRRLLGLPFDGPRQPRRVDEPPCREQQQDSPSSASHPPTACALFLKHNEARHSRHYDDAAGLDPKQHQHQRPA